MNILPVVETGVIHLFYRQNFSLSRPPPTHHTTNNMPIDFGKIKINSQHRIK